MRAPSAEPSVLHRDAWFLVLNKPSGLPTTSPRAEPTLTSHAQQLDPSAPRLHPSSRLDAEVTGVVIFARSARATEHLLAARAAGRYRRAYLALTPRAPDPAEGRWDGTIALDPRDPRKRVVAEQGAQARAAETLYRTLEVLPFGALLLLWPQTGRTHQLRVHAAAAGVPLLGDRHYGGSPRVVLPDGSVLAARRTMLHCARVCIPGPDGAPDLCFEAPLPPDFDALLHALGGSVPVLPP